MRAWLSVLTCACLASVIGCGGESRGSLIDNTMTKMSAVATSLGNIKTKVADFVKKKESGKDEEGAKKELDGALIDAESMTQAAKEWQAIIARSATAKEVTEDEKKEFAKKKQARIDEVRTLLIESQVEMKKVVNDANKRYEEPMRKLMQELAKAEGEFAVVVRKK